MKKTLIKTIDWYQKNVSLWLDFKGVKCKYIPTCSEYTKQAIIKYGTLKGMYIRRFKSIKV